MRRVTVYNDEGKHKRIYDGYFHGCVNEPYDCGKGWHLVAIVETDDGDITTPLASCIRFKEPPCDK